VRLSSVADAGFDFGVHKATGEAFGHDGGEPIHSLTFSGTDGDGILESTPEHIHE
jgi:hypothetical protein